MTKSETGDSTSTPTIDQNTDSRHESVALMEEIRRDESFSRESSVTSARVSDKNGPEKEQEFAVPGLPSLNRGKNRTSKTISSEEKIVDDKETDKENTKDSAKTDEDKKDERKRVGSSISVDVQEDLNEKPEENVSLRYKQLYLYLTGITNLQLVGISALCYALNGTAGVENLIQSEGCEELVDCHKFGKYVTINQNKLFSFMFVNWLSIAIAGFICLVGWLKAFFGITKS